MAVTTTKTNKPLNPRGNDQSPKGYNRAELYSGKALDFDGVNDSIDISNFSLNGYTAFSICFHKVSDFNNAMIFSSADSISDGVNIYQVSPGYFRARLNGSNIDTDLQVSTKDGFFVLTYDGTNLDWYYEAQNIGTGTISQTLAIANTTSTIGRQSYAAAQYLNGDIAGFKIFNTALTAAQVADLYNNPEKIVPTGVADSALKLWLPMQEGAGTTAYDGSGNGNHGTISGATYTHGIGAPVSQTAVIDWNKGQNELQYSEAFDNADWTKSRTTITANDTTAPDGSTNADKLEITTSGGNNEVYRYVGTIAIGHALSVYVKKDTARWFALGTNVQTNKMVWFDLDNGVVGTEATGYTGVMTDEGNGWYRCGIIIGAGAATSTYIDMSLSNSDGVLGGNVGLSVFIWGAQVEVNDSIGAYIPTLFGTAQTSPVLLPQGLTTGRDITGVNLFENVRKQGALNLDGNSWAEVHDNASVDFTSGMSLEAWVQIDDADGISQHILGKWNSGASKKEYLIYYNTTSDAIQFYFGHGATVQYASFPITATGQWFHFVGTTDGSTITPYVNGVAGTTAAQTTALAASDIDVTIGTDDTNGVNAVQKQIAQPRIYNRALTAEEVERNYNAGKNIYS